MSIKGVLHTGPSTQPEDDTSANIVRDTPSPTDAETGAKTNKTNSERDSEILNIGEEQGEDVADKVNLEEKTTEIDEGWAGSDPGKTPESRSPPECVLMKEDQAGPDPGQIHVALVGLDPEPMHDDCVAIVYPQVHESLKHPDEEHVYVENSLSSTRTLSSMKNLDAYTFGDHILLSFLTSPHCNDLTPPKPVSSTIQEPVFTATTETTTTLLITIYNKQRQLTALASRISALETVCANFEKRHKLQDKTVQGPSSRVFTLELRDLPHKIDQTVNEAVKEAVQVALQAPLRERFPRPPLAPQSLAWKTSDTRESPSSSSKKKFVPHSEQPVEDVPMPDDTNISDSEDIDTSHLPKIKFEMEEFHLLLTDQVDLVNPEGHRVVPDVSKPLPLGGPPNFGLEELVPSLWIKSEREYDISAAYGISHWWFKRKEFYIIRHSASSDRSAVRSHLRILSVVSLKTYERYGYTFLEEIVLRRADYKEYKILEADFKNLHPNNFEDLYLLHLQDYTIVNKPRAVIYRDRNDQKKMMRETEVHKFSDGTLNRILDNLDHMVKDFKLFKFNPGIETRIWSEVNRRRSKEFMEVIDRRLKIRRIFKSLESFVSERLRDVDYKLI
ncbi:hypothetical protein Tco_0687973 [Tanacetum coccineum]